MKSEVASGASYSLLESCDEPTLSEGQHGRLSECVDEIAWGSSGRELLRGFLQSIGWSEVSWP